MKAPFTLSTAIDKTINIIVLIGVMVWVMYPTMVKADNSLRHSGQTALVFEVKNLPTQNFQNTDQAFSINPPSISYATLVSQDLGYQTKAAYKDLLRAYLTQRRSPFAQCVDLLVDLSTSDKILSLGNAESSMGLRAPAGKHNYWGIGGSNLWKMGNNVCEGIKSMDNFLNEYPLRSAVKYKDMSIVSMCGLYKQPCPGKANNHWAKNNNKILAELANLKTQAQHIALEKINNGTTVVAATSELTLK